MVPIVAQWGLVIPAALTAGVIILRRRWAHDLVDAFLSGLVTIVFVKIAAAAFFEKRPFIVEHVHPLVTHSADNAFPSDHLAACGLAFAYLWPRSKAMAIVTLIAAAAIGAARFLARLHWPLDLAVGFVAGAGAGLLVTFIRRRWRPQSERALGHS